MLRVGSRCRASRSCTQAYADQGLKVVAISADEPGTDDQIRSFVSDFALTFEILHDRGGQEGKVSKDYQTSGYPETIIIGRDGIIRKKLLGAHDWNSAENRGLIERLLAEKAELAWREFSGSRLRATRRRRQCSTERATRPRCKSLVILSQDVHSVFGGVVPEIASRAHLTSIVPVVSKALADAGIGAG